MHSLQEKIDWTERQITMKRNWLASHGEGSKTPWPKDDCDRKRDDLEILKEIRDDYQSALDRRQSA